MSEKPPKVVYLDHYRKEPSRLCIEIPTLDWQLPESVSFKGWIIMEAAWYRFDQPKDVKAFVAWVFRYGFSRYPATPHLGVVIRKEDDGYHVRLYRSEYCLDDPIRTRDVFENSLRLMDHHKNYELVLSHDGYWSAEEGHDYEELIPAVFMPPMDSDELEEDSEYASEEFETGAIPAAICHLELDALYL
ncbi:MAG: hypothetical protein LAT62_13725 [Natronospirillum sp.]|uniref:hypothetical protein n=1 Tax=Natronospirillum sp. TaxID=2812955 RepID=UPI0025FB6E22|nr:hypothetical protein [Natronospirillum sp.]MCH8552991.1 hypothetical protein [Natronospirillum sp.]